jgi:ACS family hexuronate transporter-like MFS transporter
VTDLARDDDRRLWRWWVSGLLLLATMLNYMDRQTLANLSVRITDELSLTQERYGDLELAFGWAFAVGSLFFGILADRLPVRWLYPTVVVGWSLMGLLTGLSSGYGSMLVCRTLLGFFEAGHWPCALKTTQALLTREDRIFGNSLLQSGGAIGAILTPLVIRGMVGDDMTPGVWRLPFVVIGAIGAVWVGAWLATVRKNDLTDKDSQHEPGEATSGVASATGFAVWREACLTNRRFWAVAPMVICINITWHLIRVWLPKFLQQGRGASEAESLFFNSLYYAAADVGCIAAGAAGIALAKKGFGVHRSRMIVVGVCASLTALTTVAAMLPRGYALYAVLLVIGAGSMGLFPCYYTLAQEVSPKHLGKATGLLATMSWLVTSPMQKFFGRVVDRTGSFDLGFALAGWAPSLAFVTLILLWPRSDEQPKSETP